MFTPDFEDGHPRPYHPPGALGPLDARHDTVPGPVPVDVKAVRPPTEATPVPLTTPTTPTTPSTSRHTPVPRRVVRRVLGALILVGCVTCVVRGTDLAADLLGSAALALLLPDLVDDRNAGGPRPPVA